MHRKVKVKLLSCVQHLATPWTVACQTPLSMGFSRQEHWNGLPFPSPGDLPDPGIELWSPALQADSSPSEPPGKSTDKLYKKYLNDLDNHNGEPDILEWEVKWASGTISTNKVSGGDGIPAELFQILKDDAVKVLHSIYEPIWKTPVTTGLEKVSFHSNPKEGNVKDCSNYSTVVLISHASKVMLKILQARVQQHMNQELPDVQPGFRKGRETTD